jgi:hypothetical protein
MEGVIESLYTANRTSTESQQEYMTDNRESRVNRVKYPESGVPSVKTQYT